MSVWREFTIKTGRGGVDLVLEDDLPAQLMIRLRYDHEGRSQYQATIYRAGDPNVYVEDITRREAYTIRSEGRAYLERRLMELAL